MKNKLLFLFFISIFLTSCATYEMPPGNYEYSCNQCSVTDAGRLKCFCRNNRGFVVLSRLFLNDRCRFIENINGRLTCTRFAGHRAPVYPRRVVQVGHGPIWSNSDADVKCPRICSNRGPRWSWTGQWHTVNPSVRSVCECVRN